MRVIGIENSSGLFRCHAEGWLEGPAEMAAWQRLLTYMLQYSFSGRSATFITIAPMPWSIGHAVEHARHLRLGKAEYLVNYVRECSLELLAEVSESEDFRRGLLWLSGLDENSRIDLDAVIQQIARTSGDQPSAAFEALILLDDARSLHWLNPGRDSKVLEVEIRAMISEFGWKVSGAKERA